MLFVAVAFLAAGFFAVVVLAFLTAGFFAVVAFAVFGFAAVVAFFAAGLAAALGPASFTGPEFPIGDSEVSMGFDSSSLVRQTH